MNERVLPSRSGAGLKAAHYDAVLNERPDVGWFEVHAENYMGAGGPAHHYLERIRRDYPLSIHGVGLSIGSDSGLDPAHLERLKDVVDRYQPEMFSEHLAWSSHGGVFFNDLLPLPYNAETAARVCGHIDRVQDKLGRRMLLENPSTYVRFESSTMTETAFLKEVAERTGCGLLLDVNNVFVSATNHDYSALDYLESFPLTHVRELHLGGHAGDRDDDDRELLIDAHDREVAGEVWALYRHTIERAGALPTLIEWDNNVPDWPVLFSQVREAGRMLADLRRGERRAVSG